MSGYTKHVEVQAGDEAPDLHSTASVSVEALLGTPGLAPSILKRIKEADHDSSGGLNLQEIVRVFRSEQDAVAERRTLFRCADESQRATSNQT